MMPGADNTDNEQYTLPAAIKAKIETAKIQIEIQLRKTEESTKETAPQIDNINAGRGGKLQVLKQIKSSLISLENMTRAYKSQSISHELLSEAINKSVQIAGEIANISPATPSSASDNSTKTDNFLQDILSSIARIVSMVNVVA